jgi:hypothetical protein
VRFQINRLKPKPILFVGCLAVLVLCVLNPLGLASGSRDFDAYAAIRTLLSETKNAKLLLRQTATFMSSEQLSNLVESTENI